MPDWCANRLCVTGLPENMSKAQGLMEGDTLNIWLVSWQEEVGSTSHEYHMLLRGSDYALAEAACERMGDNWWPPERTVCSQGCYWQFDRGSVWLKSIVLLDEREAETLAGLRFLDEWQVSGSPDAPVICDRSDCRWEYYRP